MIMVEDGSNNHDASTLRTLSLEYNRILKNTQIFSELHRRDSKIQYNDPNM
jgi:hypothetical protein